MVVGHDSTNHETYTANGTVYYNGNVRSADPKCTQCSKTIIFKQRILAEEVTAYIPNNLSHTLLVQIVVKMM